MKNNPNLVEQPDHGHYTVCHKRSMEIDIYCRNLMIYTISSTQILILLSVFFGAYPILGVVPSILSSGSYILTCFLQALELLGMAALSYIGCGEQKFADVLLFLIYAALFISGFFTGAFTFASFMSTLVGVGGLSYSLKIFQIKNDYEQLREMEGFPLFSTVLAADDLKKKNNAAYRQQVHMPAEFNMPAVSRQDPTVQRSYSPESGKFCTISESVINTNDR